MDWKSRFWWHKYCACVTTSYSLNPLPDREHFVVNAHHKGD